MRVTMAEAAATSTTTTEAKMPCGKARPASLRRPRFKRVPRSSRPVVEQQQQSPKQKADDDLLANLTNGKLRMGESAPMQELNKATTGYMGGPATEAGAQIH